MFMVVVLPLLLYPVLGFAVLQIAMSFRERPSVVGIVRGPAGSSDFPERNPPGTGRSVGPIIAWLSLLPDPALGLATRTSGAAAFATAAVHFLDFPLLVQDGKLPAADSSRLAIVFLDANERAGGPDKKVDLIISATPDFYGLLTRAEWKPEGEAPSVRITAVREDERLRQTLTRLSPVLERWKAELRKVQLARRGIPAEGNGPFTVELPGGAASNRIENLGVLLIRVFPFMLVMWSLAGALYPAVDVCAGEKERGTMETLLISPASREEIVFGKFLTIWLFSAATALMNLVSMGLTTVQFSAQFMQSMLSVGALLWCVVLALPLSAFFSAVSLAIGAYARSSKEGQYYLLPLFIATMPLIFLTLAPGVELNPLYSLIPVTGVALLMQRLMIASTPGQVPWLYFLPVLLPVALYSWIALRWAVFQFRREEVLFREAERLDFRLWLRRLFRDKEPLPNAGQAFFCFGLIVAMRWLSPGPGRVPEAIHAGVSLLAFVAAPALFMTLLLNTRPRDTLRLHWPKLRDVSVAVILALLLLPPLAGLAHLIFSQYPDLTQLLEDRQPLLRELERIGGPRHFDAARMLTDLLVFGLLAPVCEALAFRGFMLTGLLHVMRPRSAVFLSSFLYALYHMNVFQFLPMFLLGVVLGLLTLRSKSLVPAIIFHALHNSIIAVSVYAVQAELPGWLRALWLAMVAVCLLLVTVTLWQLYRRPYRWASEKE